MPPAPRPRSQRGFSLVEALVALLLLGIALVMGLPLLLEQPGVVRRLDAQRRALGALDSTLEALRAGALPLTSARYGAGTPADPVVWVTVQPEPDPPGLFHVTLRAVWQVRGRPFERSVETLFWSGGP